MAVRSEESRGPLRPLLALLLMAAWIAVLTLPLLQPRGVGAVSLWEMRTLETARTSAGRALWSFILDGLRFTPLGVLAVYVFRDRAIGLLRAALVALPAFVLALAASGLALWLRDPGAGTPGPLDFLLPAAGAGLGILVGLASRRGLFAVLLLPLKLAAVALLAAIVLSACLVSSLQAEAALPRPADVHTADKRELVALFRGKDPRTIPAGETRTLRLTNHDVERLIAWGLPLVHSPERVRASLRFGGANTVTFAACVRVPWVGRWLNGEAAASAGVTQGRLWLRSPRLRLGARELPPALMDLAGPVVAWAVRGEKRLRPALDALREVSVEDGAATATYVRMNAPRGMLASLVWGEGESAALQQPLAAQVRAVLAAASAAPAGDERSARAYQAAFLLAREMSRSGSAVEQNRAAILALGVVLGSEQLVPLLGDVADADQRRQSAAVRCTATLHGRPDWTRHFSLSGALTVLSNVAPSNAAGLLKEELDSDGGSGFSFGDLLADRAGTTFAALATRDEASAAEVQQRVANGFRVDDFLPPGADLPENIADAELRSRYGGVGGRLYARYADEIERRVAAAPANR